MKLIKMKIEIDVTKPDERDRIGSYCGSIKINGQFFKEVGGLANIYDLMDAIADSLKNDEDFKFMPKKSK